MKLIPYAQLVRLPNVFTAFADIGMAWAVAAALGTPPAWPVYLALLAASGCLYMAGMVWNDFFDIEQDRRERPFRPLPSGRVSRGMAALIGVVLLLAGVGLAALAGWQDEGWRQRPFVLAVILALAVLFYDRFAKRTWFGPVAMGACRSLNVLLGFSMVEDAGLPPPLRWHLALAIGIYIVGVTWFARTEARASNRTALTAATVVMLAGLVVALMTPVWLKPGTSSPAFPYLLVGFGFLIGLPISRAINEPAPKHVQAAVKRAVLGLVILDATLAVGLAGAVGLLLLLLLPPALYLGRWVYST